MKILTWLIVIALGSVLFGGIRPPHVTAQTVMAGSNLDIDFNQEVPVGYSGFAGMYFVTIDLIHDPSAGPMIKRLESPITDTNDRILLDALQPFPQRVQEDFHVVMPSPGGPPVSVAVQGWREEIMTEGWEWVLPGDARFPGLFPPDQSLITRNGDPHVWSFSSSPDVPGPHQLWVDFSPIEPGETLDIHKALLWVGTPGNRIWGDDLLDDGSQFDETVLSIWEYPTVPEPSTWQLLALGMLAAMVMSATSWTSCVFSKEVIVNGKPEIQELPQRLVACVSYQGNFVGNPEVFRRLFTKLGDWAGPKGLISPESVFLSSYADDPKTTTPDELRLDACMSIPEGTAVDDGIEQKVLPGGCYAVMHAELTDPKEYETAWHAVVDWADRNSYAVDMSRPSYEVYLNNPEEHPEKHHIIDICLSVRPT